MSLDLPMVEGAAAWIDPLYLATPVATHADLDAALGCSVLAKVETLNPIRCFKGRGAELFVATRLAPGEAVICASAGNFGQAMARAARARGHACTVFAAVNANPRKVEAMRRLGAKVLLSGDDFDSAKEAARAAALRRGARFVEDGAEPAIAAGAGTIGLELAAVAPRLDDVIVPLGNGALLAGVGTAIRARLPAARITAVVAANAPSMQLSLQAGEAVPTATAQTIADGVAVRAPIPEALDMLRGRYDDVVAVTEDDIWAAMRLTLRTLGLLVEPAGVLGVAAVLAHPRRFTARAVATILCGANLSDRMLNDARLFDGRL